jgi:diguanylate cyclase (GGDEF)-like protein
MNRERQPRILVVDDEPGSIELLAGIFGDEYEIMFATEGEKALELALTAEPDVILLDVMMPGIDGYEVCRRLKGDELTADIPIIFITACGDLEAESRGLESGAMDYIHKPFTASVVKVRTSNQIELKRGREELTRLSITDGLTQLANRRRFDEVMRREHARLARSGAQLSLLLLDLDHFKAYNDTYGHLNGDVCLRRVAAVIGGVIRRPADLAARYGGEEFVCILPETSFEGAVALAEMIREGVEGLAIPHGASGVADHVTVSLGVVTARCTAEMGVPAIITQADEQLYAAKAGGRNRVRAVQSPS